MHNSEPARHEEPFFHEASTGVDFESALKHAVRQNADSMLALHSAIRNCVRTLRDEGMQCEACLLTIKACVKHIQRKHNASGASIAPYSDLILEQVVRWSIAEFYLID